MSRQSSLDPEFVEFIPETLEQGQLYVSMKYATVCHLCCCGCGMTVVTPLAPTDWKLTFDGERVSLFPSIGNWGFECQSHYWIEDNRVRWDRRWSRAEIEAGRAKASLAKHASRDSRSAPLPPVERRKRSILEWLRSRIS